MTGWERGPVSRLRGFSMAQLPPLPTSWGKIGMPSVEDFGGDEIVQFASLPPNADRIHRGERVRARRPPLDDRCGQPVGPGNRPGDARFRQEHPQSGAPPMADRWITESERG